MKADAKRFGELLATADSLRGVLEDANVRYVMVAASGHFHYVKLGRRRSGDAQLERTDVERLAACVDDDKVLRWHEWAIRGYRGANGKALLIERLPAAVVDRLPNEVLNQLKRQLRRDGNGVLVGLPGAQKGALLLWLAMQIPDESVLLVSENPPTEMPGGHVMHVYPPRTEPERRRIERLSRLSDIVFWDRVTGYEDLRALFGFTGARRRWFTLDASSVSSALRTLLGVMSAGTDARIETILSLRSSVIGRPEVTNLLVKEGEDWVESYKSDESALDAVGAFASQDVAKLGLTRRNENSGTFDAIEPDPPAEAIAPDPASVVVDDDDGFPEIPEPKAAGIEENTAAGDSLEIAASDSFANQEKDTSEADHPETTTPEAVVLSAPQTAPQAPQPVLSFGFDDFDVDPEPSVDEDDPFAPSDSFDFPVEEVGLEESSSMSAGILKRRPPKAVEEEHPLTIPVEEGDISEISEIQDDSLDEDAIQTGLLGANDLAGLARASGAGNLPETTRQYESHPLAESPTSSADASILKNLLPQLHGEEPPAPAMNLEDLRITTMEEYHPDGESGEIDLEMTSRSDNFSPHTAIESFLDEASDDYSDVVNDLDLGSLSDVLTEDDIDTSIADSADFAAAVGKRSYDDVEVESDPTMQGTMPDMATNPAYDINYLSQMVKDEDQTEEVSLNTAKLAAIKQRLSQKE